MTNENYFGSNIKLLCIAYDISQVELARRLNMNESKVSRMLTKSDYSGFSINDIRLIAEIFNSDLEKLLNTDLKQEIIEKVKKSP